MANTGLKRRKLNQSSKALSEIVDNGYPSGSDSAEAPYGGQTKRHSEPTGQRLTSPNAPRNGFMEKTRRPSGSKMSNEQMMAVNTAGSSSMMTLQVNDLLGEIRPDYDKLMSRLEKTLQRLQQIILDLPDMGPMTASEADKLLRQEAGIYLPFPNPRPSKETKYTFEYKRPTQVHVVGSLQHQLDIKSKDASTVDLAVTVPDSILQEKDFLNHRYFHKRAYYIAQVAAGIRRHAKNEFKLSFEYQDAITSKPTLIVEPTHSSPPGFLRSKSRVRIICAVGADVFPGTKTFPAKCCLRTSDDSSPTPYYNACIRSEATVELYDRLLQSTVAQCGAFRDVCRLGRLWLRQRGFGGSVSRGGFGPFEWSIVCALLLQSGGSKGRPALSPRYTCLQFFKAVLQFFAARDLTDPLLLNGATCEIPKSESPVLFDGAAQINVLFKMTPWSYQLLRQEARSTIEAFNSKGVDNFESVFVKRLDDDLLRFDQFLLLEAGDLLQNHPERDNAPGRLQKLHTVLSQALGNRARLIHLTYDHSPKWSIDKPLKQNLKATGLIKIGLLMDSEHFDRLVDHGPSAEDKAAAADFRKFWGDKAELRRFKDGSITESLVWSEETPVTQQIISYILQRHFDLAASAVDFLGDQVEQVVMTRSSARSRRSAFKLVNDAFQSLTTQLRQLEGLPLSIRSILPASSQLRHASLSPPLASAPLHPIDIIIEFEGSARWPDSLPAIQRTKIAFLIKLGDLLSASNSTMTTRIGLENTVGPNSPYSNTSFLDIILPSPQPHLLPPIAFRLRIHHDRTLTLLQKALSSPSISTLDRSALTSTLQSTSRQYLATPLHTTTLSRLCTLYPTLPSTIHLLKSWTSSHHLTHSIPEEILEILAARPYVHPSPYPSIPGSAQTAFLRALGFIASWDWMAEPVIVDLNHNTSNKDGEAIGGFNAEDISQLQTRFQAWRKTLDPALSNMIWFVGTNLDPTGVVWTQAARPPKVVAGRFTALARACVELVRAKPAVSGTHMRAADDWSWKDLFSSPLADYDLLIHLKPHLLTSAAGAAHAAGSGTQFRNLQLDRYPARASIAAEEAIEAVGFDPTALFLADLERCLGENVTFFHGGSGGGREAGRLVIAGLWNPRVLASKGKEWRVKMGCSTVPIRSSTPGAVGGERDADEDHDDEDVDGEVEAKLTVRGVINQKGILAEIAMLGEGLVERIEVVRGLVAQR